MKPIVAVYLLIPTLALTQSIYLKKDDFTGTVKYFSSRQEPKLEGGSFFSMRYVHFQITGYSPISNAEKPYNIEVDTTTQGWIFIQPGESLILKIDGVMMPISGPGSLNNRELGLVSGSVNEFARYPITHDQLRILSKAKEIQFRIVGSKQLITGTFTPEMLVDLKYCAKKLPKLINDQSASEPGEEQVSTGTKPISRERILEDLNKDFKAKNLEALWSIEGDYSLICTTLFSFMSKSRTQDIRDKFTADAAETFRDQCRSAGFKKIAFRTKAGEEFIVEL